MEEERIKLSMGCQLNKNKESWGCNNHSNICQNIDKYYYKK